MKKKNFLCFILILFFTTTLTSCFNFSFRTEADPSTFNDYTKELLIPIIGNDEFTNHLLFKNPENYGLPKKGNIDLPAPSKITKFDKILINGLFYELYNYDYKDLNFDQQMTYNVLTNLVDSINNKTEKMAYLDNNFLGSYLGYQAQLPLLLNEYKFYDEDDIMNYLELLNLIPLTFTKYVEFEEEKAYNGYGMPDFVIDKVIDQCNDFLNNIENHFLIQTFEDRIKGITLETCSEDFLIELHHEIITNEVAEGFEIIRDRLPKLYGQAKNNLGLAHYDIGKEYYTYLFQNETGYDIKIEKAIAYIEEKLTENYLELREIINSNPNITDIVKNTSLMTITPKEQIEAYKTLINKNFPKLKNFPNINIKYVDKSMEEHFSPAAYLTSPIDYLDEQFIYLNEAEIKDDYNYLYSTLAHEGLPGHLYQDVYFKSQDVNLIRKILKNSGYTEGWATYTEMYSLSLVEEKNRIVADYLLNENEFYGALQCRLDMGIHYEGWDLDDVLTFINKYLEGYTQEKAQQILEQIIEVPTNPQIYFFTYFKILDMRNRVETALGNKFNEIEFHKTILDCGPVPLKYVEIVIDDYIKDNK